MTSGTVNQEDNIIVSNLYDIFGDYIAIAYKDNNVMSSRGSLIREDKIIEILEESNSRKSLLNLNKDSKLYIATFNYPIYIDESYYGNIVIQKDYTKEYNENYKIICSIFIGQSIILLILVMALWSIISKFTKPINNLSNAIENFAIGKDEGDIKVETKDEVAILADKFNVMKNEIKYQMEIIIKEQNKSREFFNNATHELKTPITAISGYTQLLIDKRHKLQNILITISMAGCAASVVISFATQMSLAGNLASLLGLLTLSLAFYLSVIRKKKEAASYLITIAVNLVLFPLMYMLNGGVYSGMPLWLAFGLVLARVFRLPSPSTTPPSTVPYTM